ncbi:MAG: SMP-30/gluconolactonase/LRE family protein [Myxococcota bacterium]
MLTISLALLACKPSPTETDEPPTPVPVLTGDTAVLPTADTAPQIPTFDCTALPTGPFPNRIVPSARAYHGIAFDTLGNMVGSNGDSLLRTAASNDTSLWVPDVSPGQQMDFLPGGDLVFAHSNGNLLRITPPGNSQVLASNVNAYGVMVGPDGFVYTANQNTVDRIDPDTGDREAYITGVSVPKVLNWSPALDRMYIGTNSSGGAVYEVVLDPVTLEPQGPPTLLANTSNTWHDGLAVDVCGNLYVAEFWDKRLWRITPDGDASVLVQYPSDQYGHGVVFGSGIGEWDAMAIYVPQPYNQNRVAEAIIGIPERRFNGGVYETIH